ncbi:MAG: Rne/Rng family ribonuclease [Phycisphaera sp.]|nr:MAG: Rne/Rng family ribonuclease [Phycisphaera sp.]
MPKQQMLISYHPGEECRVAILENGVLEDYHAERPATANRVNNLYLGKVTNIESSLQAAFVDFGGPESAFVHTSDIHPQFFPKEDSDTTEKIGKKTARRDRPPIQQCLKKGQQVIVQILKDGVGTKGPAATTYLSIPGKYLVMMPQMDNVGVSRKMEDEDMRRKMRDILDSIDLPEGFGFILRTAGFGRTKTELKRDLAYLMRLWKNIEKRKKATKKPALLYAESDLLVRALRDLLTSDIDEVIIDHEQGLARAANFLKVVAPRSGTKLLHYNQKTPIFHAYGIEEQHRLMIAREVPLKSGGRLVIDETEALVAIDVNSGKSRKAKDAETNAYQTNLEAVDEICRQLKLRELGGLVINDLIDMNQAKHRKAIEQRFKERLKNDRAKSTVLPISPFGILEMTRQRMRPSSQGIHYQELPANYGRGWVRKPESVAAEALRELQLILSYDKVQKAELIVPGRVAGELLSNRRKSITRMELITGKSVIVRVSDSLGTDRFTVYAYDDAGNDVDTSKLPKPKAPKSLPEWTDDSDEKAWDEVSEEKEILQAIEEHAEPHPLEMEMAAEGELLSEKEENEDESESESTGKKKRRRRRRGGRGRRKKSGDAQQDGEAGTDSGDSDDSAEPKAETDADDKLSEDDDAALDSSESQDEDKPRKKRRRRRRRKSSGSGEAEADVKDEAEAGEDQPEQADESEAEESETDDAPPTKKRRRRRSSKPKAEVSGEEPGSSGDADEPMSEGTKKKAKKKSTRKRSSKKKPAAKKENPPSEVVEAKSDAPAAKKPRLLYSGSRRKLKPSEKAAIGDE